MTRECVSALALRVRSARPKRAGCLGRAGATNGLCLTAVPQGFCRVWLVRINGRRRVLGQGALDRPNVWAVQRVPPARQGEMP